MSQLILLHITDLHLDDVNSTNENLRKAFYKEFIDGLIEKITETINSKLDFVICTGDFVNKGKIVNFAHAETILNYLLKKVDIPSNQVAICIGNHDSSRELDKDDKPIEARKEYIELEQKFHFEELIVEKTFYKIYYSKPKDVYLIAFDSTFGSKGSNIPSKLSDAQIDEMIMDLDEKIPNAKTLLVLSHYPMILFNRSQVVAEVDDWVDDHLWKSGNILVERIYKKRRNMYTLWLFGDGHIPDFWSYNNYHHFLMTGMIGGNYVNPTYKTKSSNEVKAFNKTNEAKVILLDIDKNELKINTYSYKSKAYDFSPHTGYWEHTLSEKRLVDNPFEKNDSKKVTDIKEASTKSHDTLTTLVSKSVQEEIINQIREKKLYSFNRFSTSSNEVSLGWISLNKLFENNELLSRCIVKSIEWIRGVNNVTITRENSIFIGIDFWGSIFASQASIILNIENYCIATKSKSEHNVLLEKPEFMCKKIESKAALLKNIFLFTDVISTGNTVVSIQNKIISCLPPDTTFNWIAVSIISDVQQPRKIELNNFTALGSLCLDLRIPILSNNDLPDVDILPIKYDLR